MNHQQTFHGCEYCKKYKIFDSLTYRAFSHFIRNLKLGRNFKAFAIKQIFA